jgi:uncharacterized protein YyaL (SSP411 family)
MGVLVPVDEVYRAVRAGEIPVPRELRKAILKHENEIKQLTQSIAKRAIETALTSSSTDKQPAKKERTKLSQDERKLQSISDLFIAALLHL